jgi:hypothetical protein
MISATKASISVIKIQYLACDNQIKKSYFT